MFRGLCFVLRKRSQLAMRKSLVFPHKYFSITWIIFLSALTAHFNLCGHKV